MLFKNATLIFIQITILISASGDVLLPMLSLPYDDCSLKKKTNKQKEKGKQSEHKQFRKISKGRRSISCDRNTTNSWFGTT